MKVSVVVPIYNVAPYLERCVESLFSQTLTDIEFIFVDDCSTDDSLSILQQLVSTSCCQHQCQIIHNEKNAGISETRRRGFLLAKGEYIATCDADDWAEPVLYEQLYNAAGPFCADIVFCDYYKEFPYRAESWHFQDVSASPIHCIEFASDNHRFPWNIWTCIIRKEIAVKAISQVYPTTYGEDIFTMLHSFYLSKTIAHVPYCLYHYNRSNCLSVMQQHSFPADTWETQRQNIDRLVTLLQPEQNPQYQLTCQWLKFKLKEKLLPAFPDLRSFYYEYAESYRDIMRFEYMPISLRRKLRIIYFSFSTFWLYEHLYAIRRAWDRIRKLFLFQPRIMSTAETVSNILTHQASLSRFGDGELKVMYGGDINFQPADPELSARLREVANSDDSRLLVGIPDIFRDLNRYCQRDQQFWQDHLTYLRPRWYSFLKRKKTYASTFLTRFYSTTFDREKATEQLALVRKLWQNRHLLIVEGEDSKVGVGNDLLDNAASIRRILCPSRNAFASYATIMASVQEHATSDMLVILALGPTATVLAYDLCRSGYQALDLGHIDIEYEWYLKKVSHKAPVTGKFSNEAYLEHYAAQEVTGDLHNMKYEEQIVCRIETIH